MQQIVIIIVILKRVCIKSTWSSFTLIAALDSQPGFPIIKIISDPTHDQMHLRLGKVLNLTKCNFSTVEIISRKENNIFSSPRKVSASNWSVSASLAGVTSPASELLSMNAFKTGVWLVSLFKEPLLGPNKRNEGLCQHFFFNIYIFTRFFLPTYLLEPNTSNSVST